MADPNAKLFYSVVTLSCHKAPFGSLPHAVCSALLSCKICWSAETGSTGGTFADDAIRIFKYSHQYANTSTVDYKDIDTVGSISVDINANRDGSGQANDNHLSYAVRWCVISMRILDAKHNLLLCNAQCSVPSAAGPTRTSICTITFACLLKFSLAYQHTTAS